MQMQSTSYIPAYYHVIDQNVGGGNGSLWQVLGSSSSSTCKIGMVYNVLPESSISDPYLAYNKEILRQTMLKHEAVFRNQVLLHIKNFNIESYLKFHNLRVLEMIILYIYSFVLALLLLVEAI